MQHQMRFQPKLPSILTCLVALTVPTGCSGPDRYIEHPIRDSLSINPDEAIVIRRNGNPPESVAGFVERLADRETIGTTGVMDGPPEYQFGHVSDVTFLSDTSYAVLDRLGADVHVFTLKGRHLYSIGGKGEGPGELDAPVALVKPNVEELWVIDGARRIHRFGLRDGVLTFRERLSLQGFAHSACGMNGSVVVHVPSHVPDSLQGEVLFVFDREGEKVHGFAAPYRYSERLTAERMKRGSIACIAGEAVALGFEAQNRLDLYSVGSGQLQWHSTFAGLRIPRPQERTLPDGRPSLRVDVRDMEYFHFLLSVSSGHSTPIIVQYGRRKGSEVSRRIDRMVVETYLVDPATGEGAYVGDSIPQILQMEGELVAFVVTDPYPSVEIARLHPPMDAVASPGDQALEPPE